MCTRECMCEWVCVCVCGLTHNAICWTRRGRRGGGWLRVSCELIRFKCESEVFTRQPLAARNYCLRIALIKSFCGRANYLSRPLSLSWLCPPPLSAAWLSIKFPGNGWHGKKLSARSEHRPGVWRVRCTDIPVACLACEQCTATVNIYLFTLDSSM